MAKVCNKCGYQSDDSATVCESCGATFGKHKEEKNNPIFNIPFLKDMKPEQLKKIGVIAVAAGAVLAVVIVIISAIASGSGAKGALKTYFKAVENENFKKYISVMSEGEKKLYNLVDDEALEIEIEDELKNRMDNLEDKYGKNVKFKIKVTDKDEMTTKSLNVIRNAYSLSNDLAEVEVKKGVELDFEIEIKGKEESAEGFGSALVIKEDGKWKVYEIELNV